MSAPPTKVLIVDDSASVREALSHLIGRDPTLQVVGTAADPVIAWDKIKTLKPDVLSLDVEMPRLDGLSFLERLMAHYPLPVVMVSSLTERGCATTMRALELGAIDFVAKPKLDVVRGLEALGAELVAKLKVAARARVRPHVAAPAPAASPTRPRAGLIDATHKVIAIGASTGGCEALKVVIGGLPASAPGVVVVQHMPPMFTRALAETLDRGAQVRVAEAADGDRILPGHVLLAPGGRHLRVRRSGADYRVEIFDGAPVHHCKPAVDILFQSCARELGKHAVGAILTGMGDDGARGLEAMRAAGAHTIAQDEATCVVFGMPRAAIARNAAAKVLPLSAIAQELIS